MQGVRVVCLVASAFMVACAHIDATVRPSRSEMPATTRAELPPDAEARRSTESSIRTASPGAYAQVSGMSFRAVPPNAVLIGQGFSRLSAAGRGFGLAVDSGADIEDSTETETTYDVEYVDSLETLAKSLRIQATASFSGFSGGGSAKASFLRETKFSSNKVYALASVRVVTGGQTLKRFQLKPEALSLLDGSSADRFYSTYGDSFIYRVTRGAELYAVLEFSLSSTEDRQEFAAEVSGGMGGFKASIASESKLQKLLREKNVRVRYLQIGGQSGRTPHPAPLKADTANIEIRDDGTNALKKLERLNVATTGGTLILSPDEFLGRLRDFDEEAKSAEGRKNSRVLHVDVLDYNAVGNLPAARTFEPRLLASRVLEDMGRIKLNLDQEANTVEQVNREPNNFSIPADVKPKIRENYLDYTIRILDRMATDVSVFPQIVEKAPQDLALPSLATFSAQFLDNSTVRKDYKTSRDCQIPVSGDIDLFMRCLFAIQDREKDWRLSALPLYRKRITGTSLIPFVFGQYPTRFTILLKDQSGRRLLSMPQRLYATVGTEPGDMVFNHEGGVLRISPKVTIVRADNASMDVSIDWNIFRSGGNLITDAWPAPEMYLHWTACVDVCGRANVGFSE